MSTRQARLLHHFSGGFHLPLAGTLTPGKRDVYMPLAAWLAVTLAANLPSEPTSGLSRGGVYLCMAIKNAPFLSRSSVLFRKLST